MKFFVDRQNVGFHDFKTFRLTFFLFGMISDFEVFLLLTILT